MSSVLKPDCQFRPMLENDLDAVMAIEPTISLTIRFNQVMLHGC